MGSKYKKCTKCESRNAVEIIYGYPCEELLADAEAGKVKLGGCCIEDDMPEYFCNDCKNTWTKEDIKNKKVNK